MTKEKERRVRELNILKEYEHAIKKWDKYPDAIKPTIYLLGLMGELGEVTNKFKKVFRDHGGVLPDRQMDYALELGDILWYFTRFSNSLGFTLEEIIEYNYEKLESRYQRGKIHGEGDER